MYENHSYFISDLHLTPERPQITAAFFEFLKTKAHTSEALYILGDLFEFWIGDDAAELLQAQPLLDAMLATSTQTDCYFVAGNRDFLVTDKFSELTGFQILADETVIDLYDTPTLILHGDSLCIDDLPHMAFRENMTTNEQWKQHFLTLPIEQRIEQAKQARMQSQENKQNTSMEIMDVSEPAVVDTFKKYQVLDMIHGHTHRQNVHKYDINDETATRTVLGDWYQQTSILKACPAGLEISNQEI